MTNWGKSTGLVLEYHFPQGPRITVRLCELACDPEIRDVIRFYTKQHGQAVITEPGQLPAQQSAAA